MVNKREVFFNVIYLSATNIDKISSLLLNPSINSQKYTNLNIKLEHYLIAD